MKKNQIIFFVIVLVLVMSFGYFYKQPVQTKPTTTASQLNFLISVHETIETNPLLSIESKIKSGTTALDLLKQTTKIGTKGDGVNAYVVTINNRTASNTDKEFWAFYVNGKPETVGAGSYKLMPNDKILWKIEKF